MNPIAKNKDLMLILLKKLILLSRKTTVSRMSLKYCFSYAALFTWILLLISAAAHHRLLATKSKLNVTYN